MDKNEREKICSLELPFLRGIREVGAVKVRAHKLAPKAKSVAMWNVPTKMVSQIESAKQLSTQRLDSCRLLGEKKRSQQRTHSDSVVCA